MAWVQHNTTESLTRLSANGNNKGHEMSLAIVQKIRSGLMSNGNGRITAGQWLAAALTVGVFFFGYVVNVRAEDVKRIAAVEQSVSRLQAQFGVLLQKENDLIDALNGKHISNISQ